VRPILLGVIDTASRPEGGSRPRVLLARAGRAAIAALLGVTLALDATGRVIAQSPSPVPSAPEPSGPVSAPIGERASDALGPTISLELGEGWIERTPLAGPILTFERPDMPGGVLTITRFDGDAYADSCDPTSLTTVEPSAERLIEIIAGNPWLDAEPPEPVEVGGVPGLSVDLVAPPFDPSECALPLLLLWAIPMEDGEFVQVAGQASRFIATEVGRDTIVIAIETLPGLPFEPFALEAMEVVRTLAFEAG
jgi:hypothetical protein